MILITSIIIAATLMVTQTNPVALLRNNFFIPESRANVLGASEENENFANTAAALNESEKGDNKIFLSNGFPEIGFKDARPIKKFDVIAEPDITARSAIVIDAKTAKILFKKNMEEVSAIASITKLMTALVVLDENPDFNTEYAIREDDRREGGRINLFWGDKITINDLFNASLVGSDNTATIALVHSLGFDEQEFVAKMNKKAEELNLEKTSFADPVGLSVNNKSDVYEIAKILKEALAKDKIRNTVSKNNYILKTGQGKQRIIETTDDLLAQKKDYEILGGKTGYLESAGFCFTGKFSYNGNEIITVVLGSEGVDLRFSDTDKLVNWTYKNYIWP